MKRKVTMEELELLIAKPLQVLDLQNFDDRLDVDSIFRLVRLAAERHCVRKVKYHFKTIRKLINMS